MRCLRFVIQVWIACVGVCVCVCVNQTRCQWIVDSRISTVESSIHSFQSHFFIPFRFRYSSFLLFVWCFILFFLKSMSHSLRETKRRARARTHINSIQYTPFASLPYLVFVFFFVFIIIITTFNAYRIAALWL